MQVQLKPDSHVVFRGITAGGSLHTVKPAFQQETSLLHASLINETLTLSSVKLNFIFGSIDIS
jgi:hypothetical protein